ncbi:MAG: hypothetical protein R2715_13850 [Ilumatobacteraceae bacterium]
MTTPGDRGGDGFGHLDLTRPDLGAGQGGGDPLEATRASATAWEVVIDAGSMGDPP